MYVLDSHSVIHMYLTVHRACVCNGLYIRTSALTDSYVRILTAHLSMEMHT